MKKFPKFLVLSLSVLFLASGIFIKLQIGKEGQKWQGTVSGEQTNMVSGRYPDIPVYANAVIVSVLEKNNTVVVSLESKDGPQTIVDYYQNVLKTANWTGGPNDFTKEDKKLSVGATQNQTKTQTAVVLNYSFVPTK